MAKKPATKLSDSTPDVGLPITTPTPQTLPAFTPNAIAPGKVVTQSDRESFAQATADRLAKDADLLATIDEQLDAEDTRKLGPVHILYALMKANGCPIPTSKKLDVWGEPSQVLRAWPMAGYQAKGLGMKGKPEIPANAGRWSDYYGKTVYGDGKSEVINGSYYEDVYYDIDRKLEGNSLQNKLKFLKDAALDEPTLADNPYIHQTKAWCRSEKNRTYVRLNRGAEKLRKAMQVSDKIFELYDAFDGVITISFMTETTRDDKGKRHEVLARTDAMLVIADYDRPAIATAFEVSGFLALDVNKAEKEGGEYQHIVLSGKKTRDTSDRVPGTGSKSKLTADAMSKFGVQSLFDFSALAAFFFEDEGKVSDLWKELAKPDRATELMTLGDIAMRLGRMFYNTSKCELTSLGKKWKAATEGALDGDPENKRQPKDDTTTTAA